jgi:hypothetical protein
LFFSIELRFPFRQHSLSGRHWAPFIRLFQ